MSLIPTHHNHWVKICISAMKLTIKHCMEQWKHKVLWVKDLVFLVIF